MKKILVPLLSFWILFGLLSGPAPADAGSDLFTTDLVASQHYDVGEVLVWNDAKFLYVKYDLGYVYIRLFATHLHVAESPDGIPQKNGNPVPGQFDHQVLHDRWVHTYTYKIPLETGWRPGTTLCIASHAVITGECGIFATAWGDGPGFPGKNWATYFTYTLE